LCRVEELAAEMLMVKRDKRRCFLNDVILDIAGGIRSLGELDFVRGCTDRGLPVPDAHVLRRAGSRRYYLDFRWDRWSVVVEVDGIQHTWAEQAVGDALRHNFVALSSDTVLRLPVMGLRLCPDEFFAQIGSALRARGCPLAEDVPA
jgi:hypothetical protein